MAVKRDLQDWVLEAIQALGGKGSVVEVSREVWRQRESDLRGAGDLFFTWQYDIRWAAQVLRDDGKLVSSAEAPRGVWMLAPPVTRSEEKRSGGTGRLRPED